MKITISMGLRNYLNNINYQEIGYEKDEINKVFLRLPETLIFLNINNFAQ